MATERAGALIEAFLRIRDVPYATDGASDASGLAQIGRGNCLAKADAMAEDFAALGVVTRKVRWLYQLPEHPPEIALLPTPLDIHTAIEAQIDGRWVLVDATHDVPLRAAGLRVVESWDGSSSTPPAYEPIGAIWRVGDPDPEPALASWPTPEAAQRYLLAFNRWLVAARSTP